MFWRKIYPFPYTKKKVKNIIIVVRLLNISLYFWFSLFPPFQYLSCISCYVKNLNYYLGGSIFLVILFSFSRRTLCNTWKRHYRQLLVLIMILTKRLLWIFLASPTQKTQNETFWVLYRKLLLMNISKRVGGIVLAFLWFRIIGKTINTHGFHNNTHWLDLSSLDVSSRSVFRTLSNI